MALVAMLSTAEFWSGPGGGGVGAALGSRVPSAPLSSRTAPCGVHVWKEPGAGPGCGALGALPGEVGESRGWGRSLSWGPRSSHSWPLPRAQGWVLGGPRPHGGRLAEVLVGCPSCRRGQEPALTPGIQRATPAHGPIVPSVREVCEAGGVSECAAQVGLAPGTGGPPLTRCASPDALPWGQPGLLRGALTTGFWTQGQLREKPLAVSLLKTLCPPRCSGWSPLWRRRDPIPAGRTAWGAPGPGPPPHLPLPGSCPLGPTLRPPPDPVWTPFLLQSLSHLELGLVKALCPPSLGPGALCWLWSLAPWGLLARGPLTMLVS
jgi:hypothetical protein